MSYPINIIGLGSGNLDQMPLGIYRLIKETGNLIVRTQDHLAVSELVEEGINVTSLDAIYEQYPNDFDRVYEAIVEKLITLSETKPVLYGVPGHPNVAEKTVKLLLESKRDVSILGGKSFIDDLFKAVKIDPVEGFQLLDSFELNSDHICLDQHVIIMQVFNSLIASDVKLTLMEKYPWDHEVYVVDAAGSTEEKVTTFPLHEIDYFNDVKNLRSLYIPPLEQDEQVKTFNLLSYYTDKIVSNDGDAWIKEQTHQSLISYLKEETAELIKAIETDDIDNMIEELGDVLMQVMYQARLAELNEIFQLEDVLETLNRKLRRRHPHIFDEVEANTIEEVSKLWQAIKKQEKGQDNQ